MIRFRNLSWLAASLVVVMGMAHAAAAVAGEDEAAIRQLTTDWGKAYNGGDAEALAAMYAEDALLMPPGHPGVKGRAAILEFFKGDVAASQEAKVVFVLNPETDVGIFGDMGWETGTYAATIDGAVVDTGKFMSVNRKQDGKWYYVRDTWNSDVPPAPAQ